LTLNAYKPKNGPKAALQKLDIVRAKKQLNYTSLSLRMASQLNNG